MFLACSSSTVDSADSEQKSLQAGSHAVLSQAEFRTYTADRKYIQSLARPDVPVRLNFADDKQFRFVLTRLKIAGKTPKNSPYLFDIIQARRQRHLAMGVTQGLLPGASYTTESTDGRTEKHFMAATTAGTPEDPDHGEAAASASIRDPELDGQPYVYTDAAYYDAGGNPLSDIDYVEEFGDGVVTTASATADLSLAAVSTYDLDSYHAYEDDQGMYQDSYVFTQKGVVDEVGIYRGPTIELGAVPAIEPKDNDGDGEILTCLSRSHSDCDYKLLGMWQVKLPLKGSAVVTSDHYIRQDDIDDIKAFLATNPTSKAYGELNLLLRQSGGGCDVQDDGALQPSMAQVWNNVTLQPDGKTLVWDLTGTDAAYFDEGCQQSGNDVYLTMRLTIPVRDAAGILFHQDVTLSNNARITTEIHEFLPMRMVNSCLAAGTMIQLPDGQQQAIESIATGDRISNPYHADAQSLTVTDISVGTEPIPMYRIEDEAGRSILMTEMHPIQTPDRGMVAAKYIREGDVVMTKTGPSKLTRVTREKYDGKVYNLKVGSESEMAALGEDQTVVYANGFMVGDLQIQDEHEMLDMTKKKQGDVLDRLPPRWHRDYRMSKTAKKADLAK